MGDSSPFSGSYASEDVTFLLKPVALAPTETAAKERLIQSGARHYSEMVPVEPRPDETYLALYRAALARNGSRLAQEVADLAGALAARRERVVLASLARAGTPIGILLRRALARMGVAAPHYSISIIRDRGVDMAALAWIAARHDPAEIVFVDGWTGKGAIAGELRASLAGAPMGVSPFLAVIADPAGRADLAAGEEDWLIPSGILNAVVSGLVSRSILAHDLVGPGEFHACVHYRELAPFDLSRAFVDHIDALAEGLRARPLAPRGEARGRCEAMLADLLQRYGVGDRNRVKPGIAEATRAVLRRLPERLLLRDLADPDVAHLVHLAREKGLAIETLPKDAPFRAVTIIQTLGKDKKDAE